MTYKPKTKYFRRTYKRRKLNQAVMNKRLCKDINCELFGCACSDKFDLIDFQACRIPCDIWIYTEFMQLLTGKRLIHTNYK